MSRKILLVDDNVFNRKFVRDLLAITGLEVIEARSCRQGVEMAISQHPGLILLASGLAAMQESAAFATLQKVPSTSMIPILSVTSHDEEGQPAPYTAIARPVHRPIPIQALINRISLYVNAARSMVNRTII